MKIIKEGVIDLTEHPEPIRVGKCIVCHCEVETGPGDAINCTLGPPPQKLFSPWSYDVKCPTKGCGCFITLAEPKVMETVKIVCASCDAVFEASAPVMPKGEVHRRVGGKCPECGEFTVQMELRISDK